MMTIGTIGVYPDQHAVLLRAIEAALRSGAAQDRPALLLRLYELRRMRFRAFMEGWGGW